MMNTGTDSEHPVRCAQPTVYSARIPRTEAGSRVDRVLAGLFPSFSRAALQRWLRQGAVTINDSRVKASCKIAGDEWVRLTITPRRDERWRAEPGKLELRYEDADLLVVDKPAALVVHPGAGNPSGTLINHLLAYRPALATLPRYGIVHRLDKDTSGLLIVATSLRACTALSEALQQRRIERQYQALAHGLVAAERTIDAPVGRHPRQRTQMAVISSGRTALTYIQNCEHFRLHSSVAVRLGSGRTHQIRVHLAHIGHPVVGDMVYNKHRFAPPSGLHPILQQRLKAFNRQALHAAALGFAHPFSGGWLSFTSPLPPDMMALIKALRSDREQYLKPTL